MLVPAPIPSFAAVQLALAALLGDQLRQDDLIRRCWQLGWSCTRIAGATGMSEQAIAKRAREMALPARPVGFRQHHAGLNPVQMAAYRVFTKHGFTATEARAMALRSRPG